MNLESKLQVNAGCYTTAGNNDSNDDCLGIRIPEDQELATKGIAAVIADGVSAAEAGKQAAEICVKGFLNDYYSSPEAWTTKSAGMKMLESLNRWLFSLSQGYSSDGRGYVTTFSAAIFKGTRAYIFHVGDSRIYRYRSGALELLTRDHSVQFGKGKVGLARAMGMDTKVEIDFKSVGIQKGDRFVLTTDGIHGFMEDREIARVLSSDEKDVDRLSELLSERALEMGSNDNCSVAIVEVQEIGMASNAEMYHKFNRMPFPPELYVGMKMDGYEVVAELQATSRSQTYLVEDIHSGEVLVMKTPSVNYQDDTAYIERFIMESWIGHKVDSERLASSIKPVNGQKFLYTLLEYIEGPTLEKWMLDNQNPDIRKVVEIGKQVLQGLRAMHRLEMLHQDLKPGNVILHKDRGAVIIDFGSTYVAGIQEIPTPFEREKALGTLHYSAPEYFLERQPTRKSDLFSLGVMLYEMLTGKYPYGDAYEKCSSLRDFSALKYRPAPQYNSMVPTWLDGALRKCVQVNPQSRYDSFSEFEYDLEHPNPKFISNEELPFIERNPALFWKVATGVLAVTQASTILWLLTR